MQEITVYSKPKCVQCDATYRALDRAKIPYRVIDLTASPAALEYLSEELGYEQAPVVVVDDQEHWSGFRPDKISELKSRD